MDCSEESTYYTTFIEFCFLKNREERLAFLRDHPELLSSDVVSAIKHCIPEKSQDDQSEHLDLLEQCTSTGPQVLDGFFSGLELKLLFVHFCEGFQSFEERQKFLECHPELLSNKADIIAAHFIEECKSGVLNRFVSKYVLYRNLLRQARQTGIPHAFQEYGVPSEEVVAAMNTLFNEKNYARALVARDVLSRDRSGARKAFNYLRATYEGDAAHLARVETLYDFVSGIFDEQQGPKQSSELLKRYRTPSDA
jgi:hypothetical protein